MNNNETAVLIDEPAVLIDETAVLIDEVINDNEPAVLIDELLSVFVPVFVEKELDASSKQRYNPSNSEEKGENK